MKVSFQYSLDRAIQAMAYIARRLKAVEKVKLMKLMYLADKLHFLDHGYPITGDRQCAMRWGPVPSNCLSTINGDYWPDASAVFQYLHVADNNVTVHTDPGTGLLSPEELCTLDKVITKHGSKNRWQLVGETHNLPEYKDAYVDATSAPIPYESILRHSGSTENWMNDRPAVSEATLAHMTRPFPDSETDL